MLVITSVSPYGYGYGVIANNRGRDIKLEGERTQNKFF